MTVTYSLDVSSSTFLGIHKLLFRWKGSIWKSTYPELLLWLFLYTILSMTYRYVLDQEQQQTFEDLAAFFYTYGDYIPITFMLGFYVSAVFARWGEIFNNLGWIDSPALLIATYMRGADDTARNMRRNVLRYLVLTQALVYRDVSACVKKRFPTLNHLVTAGIMTENELKEMDKIVSPHIKYWQPMQWAFTLIKRARDARIIDNDIIYADLLEKLRQFRVQVLNLTLYDWVPVPLVYTQVVNLAVRSYFIIALMGRQYLITDRNIPNARSIDLKVPIMTILQFLFYVGWIKVAEVLLNPLGEDDDDFETNYIIDRNLQVGFSIVDDGYNRCPELEKDIFWETSVPELLYTVESAQRPYNPIVGSCSDLNIADDTFMLRPRKKRLFSTTSSTVGAGPDRRTSIFGTDENSDVVPVLNHHFPRSGSADQNFNGRNFSFHERSSRFGDFLKRKFSRQCSRRSRQDSESSIDLPPDKFNGMYSTSARLPSKTDNARNWHPNGISRNSSMCSSVFMDSHTNPFSQTVVSNFGYSLHTSIPGAIENVDQNQLNTILEQTQHGEDVERAANSGTWTVNELLPVIQEEEQEKVRKTANSNSTDSPTASISGVSVEGTSVRRKSTASNDIRKETLVKSMSRGTDSHKSSTCRIDNGTETEIRPFTVKEVKRAADNEAFEYSSDDEDEDNQQIRSAIEERRKRQDRKERKTSASTPQLRRNSSSAPGKMRWSLGDRDTASD
ncbi:hypothetical protein QR680_000735 [Steinernema hermaphroditum]|uniref:Bestrophin homolog n=1 Tax=Steinernema hermaphroditum TaxID=289476 RepID=A0AA39GWI8_9BILA|nr:hypothetical protein QR680_000735 [Steinernema hermaphroditum]